MGESIFPGYEHQMVSIGDQRLSVHVGGSGTPLLLLHGYPQNHAAWLKLAAPLAKHFTCVIADLPGYGASSIPADAPDHESFSKRRMAALLVSVMASMGPKSSVGSCVSLGRNLEGFGADALRESRNRPSCRA